MTEQFFVITEEGIGQEDIKKKVISHPFENIEKAIEYLDQILKGGYIGEMHIKYPSDSKILKGEYVPIEISLKTTIK